MEFSEQISQSVVLINTELNTRPFTMITKNYFMVLIIIIIKTLVFQFNYLKPNPK